MNTYIIPLEDVRHADSRRVGAKAGVLGELQAAGFPVPPGLCVTTTAFRLALGSRLKNIQAILQGHELGDLAGAAAAAERIESLLDDLAVPAPVVAALEQALPGVIDPQASLAVRSSATAEDSAEASYAGQYHSVIGVHGKEALQEAIVAVWRSFYSSNALAERAAHGGLESDEAMGVLVLPVIEAECAGVSLSVDLVQRRRERVVISAAWGLGLGVVDGSVVADTVWVRRDGSTEGFELEELRVEEQAEQMALGPGGKLKRVPVPAERRRAACLPEAWALRIAEFCVAAEVMLGCPQDMEWAIADGQVWVLQSRPITGLPVELSHTPVFPVGWESEAERRMAWVHYPYWRYVLKPLEVDYARDRSAASKETGYYSGGARYERVKFVNGRIYACWTENDLSEGDRRVRRAAIDDLIARLHSQGITTWEHWGAEIIKATERLSAFETSSADGFELAEHLEDARGVLRRHFTLHGFVWRSHYQPLYDAFAAVTGLRGPEAEERVEKLLEGEETTFTRLVEGLYTLGRIARQMPAVAALVADPPADVIHRLVALPEAAAFNSHLEDFLTSFGERTGIGYGSDATICSPTWREQPGLVLHLAAPYLNPDVEPPAVARERAQRERQALVERLCEACDDQEAVATFLSELAYARRQAVVGEEHNHYIDQLMNGQLRRAILAAADWLVRQGALTAPEDVFWLHYDEIYRALREEAPGSFSEMISARQAQHAEWERLEPPALLGVPEALLPARPALRDEVTAVSPQEDGRVRGLGASPGRHRGRARVVPPSVILPNLDPGDVLVAENMGPRWTPLLPILGAVVLDGGTLGQHAAMAAREYGVPAVIGTKNATQRIPEGAWISVDGTQGTVEME